MKPNGSKLNERLSMCSGRNGPIDSGYPCGQGVDRGLFSAADPYNAVLVRFMFETAARIDQAVSLETNDLRPSENKVRVKAQKGHPANWITVSPEMMDELLALPAKRPKNRKTGKFMKPRVFGYGSSTGYNNRWKTICSRIDCALDVSYAATPFIYIKSVRFLAKERDPLCVPNRQLRQT